MASEIKSNLEEDANSVLQFMASNGLIANESKTEFLVLNEKGPVTQLLKSIQVGEVEVQRTYSTRLLGAIIDESQDWTDQLNKLKASLNQRLFTIRRIARHIPRNKLISIVHSLWMSKLRYGLQLCIKVRLTEEPNSGVLKSLQITQNRMLRAITGTKLSERVSVKSMLEKNGLMAVNQLAATIKLTEVWKMINQEGYHPLSLDPYKQPTNGVQHNLRERPNCVFNTNCRLQKSESSFHVDAARIWNAAPISIKEAKSLNIAKSLIKVFASTLPI